jgi:hypothetical protein
MFIYNEISENLKNELDIIRFFNTNSYDIETHRI